MAPSYEHLGPEERRAHTARGRAENERRAAIRALDDPVKLARAARIVRAALERKRLAPADLGIDTESKRGAA